MTWLFFQDVVDGSVVVNSASSISHQGIRLTAVGTIMLQVQNPPQLSPQSFSLNLSWFIHWIQTYFSCCTSFRACSRHWNQAILLRSTYFLRCLTYLNYLLLKMFVCDCYCLQLSARQVGVFEALYTSVKPIQLLWASNSYLLSRAKS